MEPLSKKQTVANSLTDLALSYATRYGLDEFFLKCINKVLEQNPNDIFALGHKSDYYTHLTAYISEQLGRPSFEDFKLNYGANEVLKKRDGVYAHLDNIGYEKMPDEKYSVWLSSLDKEIKKQDKEENKKPSKQSLNIIEVKQ
jgi:hypothetical protein